MNTAIRVPIAFDNSTVDGYRWTREQFASLGFASTNLASDESYSCGCLKYLPSLLDSDPTIEHRVRSIFRKARPVNMGGSWFWDITDSRIEKRRRMTR